MNFCQKLNPDYVFPVFREIEKKNYTTSRDTLRQSKEKQKRFPRLKGIFFPHSFMRCNNNLQGRSSLRDAGPLSNPVFSGTN